MNTTLLLTILLVIALFAFLIWMIPSSKPKASIAPPSTTTDPCPEVTSVDVLVVGAGVMSTTLSTLLLQLDPNLRICMVEKLGDIALESTDALNNAGTGHAGNCEFNYTPETDNGGIDASKAFRINASFEVSLEFWSYLVESGQLPDPDNFIRQVPHYGFVWGEEDIEFLKKRHDLLSNSVAFGDMEFSKDHAQLREWLPLVMKDRSADEHIASTRVRYGTDVNFGSLTRAMARTIAGHEGMDLRTHRTVVDLCQQDDKRWMVELHNTHNGTREVVYADRVFLGAGGGALPLLQKSGIPEGKTFGGFPVSGQWLICKDPSIIEQHWGKVYGKAGLNAPPMSVPHLDTRSINGERCLLFGPFAGFSTKYLKEGSFWDFPNSITASNLKPMLVAGYDNIPLTTYLIKEVLQSQKSRVESLRRFYINAKDEDWQLEIAGQRVQIIKESPRGGKLQFGTEIVSAADGTLVALLGASPGASIAVHVMLDVMSRCYPDRIKSNEWQSRLKEMIPSYGKDLLEHDDLFRQVRARNNSILGIDQPS